MSTLPLTRRRRPSAVEGKKKSDVIRELVRRALYARRYRQASTNPAFKEILKAFDDRIGVRLHHLKGRLERRAEADLDLMLSLLGYLYFAANFSLEELKQVRYLVTPEEAGDEEFLQASGERFEATRQKVSAALRTRCEQRKRQPEAEGGGRDDSDGEYD